MYGKKYGRKRSFKRVVVTMLTFVMLLSVCFPGMLAGAETVEDTAAPESAVEPVAVDVGGGEDTGDQTADTPEGEENITSEDDEIVETDTPSDDQAEDTNNEIPSEVVTSSSTTKVAAAQNEEVTVEEASPIEGYQAQLSELQTQAENLDTSAEDFVDSCYDIYEAADAIVEEVTVAWEASEISDEDWYTVYEQGESVKQYLKDEYGFDPYSTATMVNLTIQAGSSGTFRSNSSTFRVVQNNREVVGFTFSKDSNTITVTVDSSVPAGEYTVEYRTNSGSYRDADVTISVTEAVVLEGSIKVYVYVGTKVVDETTDEVTDLSWADNAEFLELLGISANTIDGNKFFPVGEITLDASYLTGKNYNTVGEALIKSEDDWDVLYTALGEMDTSTLIDEYAANKGNKVPEYLSQVVKDINAGIGSQRTALFRWNMTTSYGFKDQSVEYHLDLRFNTKTITFITGKNGITSGDAKDGTTVDHRVYITGSLIQQPRYLTIPTGYKFAGYFEDADFTIPWDGIGTPLNEDEIVYIRIVEEDHVRLYYVNVTGADAGSLSSDFESFNPKTTDVAAGSTATAKDGYVFDGWYSDEACTQLITKEATYQPTKPEGGWVDGTTYYAKFVPATSDLTINKTVKGNLGDWSKDFTFTVTLSKAFDANASYTVTNQAGETSTTEIADNATDVTITLKHNESVVISGVPIGATLTVVETMNADDVYDVYINDSNMEGTKDDDGIYSLNEVPENGVSVSYLNYKNASIPTGIETVSFPFVLLLSTAIVGAFLLIISKRRYTQF